MSKNSKPLIRLEGIQQAFQNRVILDVNQLEIEQGKLTLLSGANGTGKTNSTQAKKASAEQITTLETCAQAKKHEPSP